MTPNDQIIDYYETCESDYRLFWDLDYSHAMHAGYWDSQTRTLRQALRRQNEVMAEWAGIKSGEKVLDAGCGVGGSSIFLAKNYGCQVLGITLSAKQAATATQKALQENVQNLASFQVLDYTCTGLPSASFDVVWAIESVCHAADKSKFVKEAARLLKPGGKLIVADGFDRKTPNNSADDFRMKTWLQGWGVDDLDTVEAFRSYLKNENFEDIRFRDITHNVLPSSQRLYWLSWPAVPLSKMGEWLGFRKPSQTANLISARCQYQTLKKGFWVYGVFSAIK